MEIYFSIIGLIFSILYSGSEIALISANPMQIKVWQKQKMLFSSFATKILDEKPTYITVILIGTNLANVLATSFFTIYLTTIISNPIWVVGIIAGIILLFGEVIPKTISREFSNTGILLFSPFLVFSYYLFLPFIFLLNKTKWLDVATVSTHTSDVESQEDRTDLQHMYEQVDEPEVFEKDQQEMISQVFDYSEKTVEEAMTPRTDISSISINSSLEEVLHVFIDSGHSKILVYENSVDHIKGVIHLYDLFKSPSTIEEIIKPVKFIPYTKSVMKLMSEFQTARHTIAIVIDEHGGTAGLVTVEDLFEELFGDFEDEFDVDNTEINQLEDGSIIANAKIDCELFNTKFGNILPEGKFETLGGYIISEIGRIPNKGENLFLPIGQVIISKSSTRSINQVKIILKNGI
ncbi:MAG: HlyC/CorC family transporter [Candidatus Marinimicrobia bacterium]|nr:HlyC/CorC family transporter [Candidatus Neomarinimicrobiota bacterium]